MVNEIEDNELSNVNKNVLARVDERTKSIQSEIGHLREEIKQSTLSLSNDIKDSEHRQEIKNGEFNKQFDEIRQDLEQYYVKKSTLAPVQYVVYGLVGIILTSVIGAFVATIIHTTTNVNIVH